MAPERAPDDNPMNAGGSFVPGAVLNGRYRIARAIGKGGFGVVYLAHDLQLHEKPVVVKVLGDSGIEDQWIQNKFRKESESLARIDHPSVVGVLDQGTTADGKLFIVMQFVDGDTLRNALKNGPLDLTRAAAILSQTADALAAAHHQGVCHRDLKPENIMLRKLPGGREQAVIIDFGIAGAANQSSGGATPTRVAGSLHYMAPEQMNGKPEVASDIYSLGVIAYEMVTGHAPFRSGSPVELYFQQQQGVQERPSQYRPELPAAADNAILKALAFEARDRYASAMEFSDDFSRAMSQAARTEPLLTSAPTSTITDTRTLEPEMAFVLFMDVVGYSQLPTNRQIEIITKLQEVVRGTPTYSACRSGHDLISLPTGDGMALVFFKSPIAPAQCAVEVARALQQVPAIKLRMGISQGPVYRVNDINQSRNVAGGGINTAQRVMDCGDAGHILVSSLVADTLSQMSEWSPLLRDLGECEVKHGKQMHIYNICGADVGNPARPRKLGPEKKSRWRWYASLGVLVASLAIAIVFWPHAVQKPQPVPPLAVQRTLTYYFSVRKPGDNTWIRYSREMVVPAGYYLRFYFNSPGPGHLYLLNEGPVPQNGMAAFNILFPTSATNHGSSALDANQEFQFPAARPLALDKDEGEEKIYIVWSSLELPQLEALRRWTEQGRHGDIQSSDDVSAIQTFLRSHPMATPHTDEQNNRTVLIQTSDPLVYMVKLAHQ